MREMDTWSWGYCKYCKFLVVLDENGNKTPHARTFRSEPIPESAASYNPCGERKTPDNPPSGLVLSELVRLDRLVTARALDANNPEYCYD